MADRTRSHLRHEHTTWRSPTAPVRPTGPSSNDFGRLLIQLYCTQGAAAGTSTYHWYSTVLYYAVVYTVYWSCGTILHRMFTVLYRTYSAYFTALSCTVRTMFRFTELCRLYRVCLQYTMYSRNAQDNRARTCSGLISSSSGVRANQLGCMLGCESLHTRYTSLGQPPRKSRMTAEQSVAFCSNAPSVPSAIS